MKKYAIAAVAAVVLGVGSLFAKSQLDKKSTNDCCATPKAECCIKKEACCK